jgi:hypothetical protein
MRARVNLGQRRRDLWRVAATRDAVGAARAAPDAAAALARSVPIDLNRPYWTAVRLRLGTTYSARNRSPDVARPW